MIRLLPMDDAAFRGFLARAIPRRAERWAGRGLWTPDQALEASQRTYASLFPQGRATPNMHFVDVVESDSDTRVGEAWYSVRAEGGKVDFEILWIGIEPEFQRRGYGSQALRLLEEEARRRGAHWTRLTVWMDNPDALRLYTKLGYTAQTLGMAKPVKADHPERGSSGGTDEGRGSPGR